MKNKNYRSDYQRVRTRYCKKCGMFVRAENYSSHMLNRHGIDVDKRAMPRGKIVIMATALILLIGIAIGYSSMSTTSSPNSEQLISDSESLSSDNIVENVVKISISEISRNSKWYTHNSNGANIRYFLVKGSDGKYHLGTDACDVCYENKRGYRQDGDVMTCNNCGQTFAINSIGTENLTGGCWPSYIPMRIEGNHIVIEKSELNEKRFMFV